MKKCPHCAKEILDDAEFCKYCNSNLTPAAPPDRPIHPKTSGRAIGSIASLILGFFFLILGFSGFFGLHLLLLPLSILAVVYGHLSCSEINRSAGRLKGTGMAIAGLTLGYCGVALGALLAMGNLANLDRSRIAVNQAFAIGSLRTLNEAAITYAKTYNRGFPPSIAALGPPQGRGAPDARNAGLIDKVLASGKRSGYVFTYTPGERDAEGRVKAYAVHADPDRTGGSHFFTDQTGVIREDPVRAANEQTPPTAR